MLVIVAKTGTLIGGQSATIRSWYSKQDIKDITYYNQLVDLMNRGKLSASELKEEISDLSQSVSTTANAAIQAANGGTVALDKLGAKFNWAALKAQALNAAVSMGIGLVVSLAASALITLVDNYIRRVEIAHEATAQKIADHEKQKSSIASLNDSLDGNYGMYN